MTSETQEKIGFFQGFAILFRYLKRRMEFGRLMNEANPANMYKEPTPPPSIVLSPQGEGKAAGQDRKQES